MARQSWRTTRHIPPSTGAPPCRVRLHRRRRRDRGRAGFTAARRGGRVGRFTPCRASMANTSCWNVTGSLPAPLEGRSGGTLRLRPPRGQHPDAQLRPDARCRDGGVREELAAGVILVCAANCPIGENNSSLEMARVDERTLDDNSLGILTLSYPRKRHRPGYWVTSSASPNARFRGTKRYGTFGCINPP